MLALGHPILGDPKYNTPASVETSGPLKLQLHARRLTLPHPTRGLIEIEAPLGPEMKAGFARFGFDPSGGRRRSLRTAAAALTLAKET